MKLSLGTQIQIINERVGDCFSSIYVTPSAFFKKLLSFDGYILISIGRNVDSNITRLLMDKNTIRLTIAYHPSNAHEFVETVKLYFIDGRLVKCRIDGFGKFAISMCINEFMSHIHGNYALITLLDRINIVDNKHIDQLKTISITNIRPLYCQYGITDDDKNKDADKYNQIKDITDYVQLDIDLLEEKDKYILDEEEKALIKKKSRQSRKKCQNLNLDSRHVWEIQV